MTSGPHIADFVFLIIPMGKLAKHEEEILDHVKHREWKSKVDLENADHFEPFSANIGVAIAENGPILNSIFNIQYSNFSLHYLK